MIRAGVWGKVFNRYFYKREQMNQTTVILKCDHSGALLSDTYGGKIKQLPEFVVGSEVELFLI